MEHGQTSEEATQVGTEKDKVIGAELAAREHAHKQADLDTNKEPLHYPPEVEARFKALEDQLDNIIKRNHLLTEDR